MDGSYTLLLYLVIACTAPVYGNGRHTRERQIRNTLLATFGRSDLHDDVRSRDLSRCQDECETNQTRGISLHCYCDVCQYERDLDNQETYAMEMFDAMGRFPSGLLKANFKWIGTYTECIGATDMERNTSDFKAQYCLAGYSVPTENVSISMLEDAISMALCVPDTCNKEDVRLLIQQDLLSRPRSHSLMHEMFDFSFVHCNESKDLSVGAIIMICISAVLGVLVLLASGYEYYNLQRRTKTPLSLSGTGIEEALDDGADEHVRGLADDGVTSASVWKQLLVCFSVVTNGAYILSTNIKHHGEETMSIFYGLRVLSLWWLLLGQTFFFHYKYMYNFFDIQLILDAMLSQAALNYRYAEDSFFILSGFLITYYSLSRLRENGKENWIYFYLHRLWRISIPYFLAFFVYVCLIEYMCTGALSYYIEANLAACHDTWWTYIIYINNIYPYPGSITGGCAPWFWFLACLMQFYIVSPPLIYLLYRWCYVGIGTIVLLIGVCITCTTLLSSYYNIPITISQIFQGYVESDSMEDYIHGKPYTRMTPYLVGMLVAYLIVKYGRHVKINKVVSAICWSISIFVGLAVVYGLYWSYQGHTLSTAETLLYHSCSKFGYSVALGWMIYACLSGNGDMIKMILSWKVWRVMDRMTFSTYLMHAFAFNIYILNNDVLMHLSFITLTYSFIAHLAFSYLAGYIFCLVVELPFTRVERVLYAIWSRSKDDESDPDQSSNGEVGIELTGD